MVCIVFWVRVILNLHAEELSPRHDLLLVREALSRHRYNLIQRLFSTLAVLNCLQLTFMMLSVSIRALSISRIASIQYSMKA